MSSMYPSRTADKFVVRLPDGLRADVERAADHIDTSMNTVFVQAVRQYLDGQQRQQLLLDALATAVTGKDELDAVLHWRNKHAVAIKERDALQQLLNERDEQLHELEQRRRAEFDAGQAAERRVDSLVALLQRVVASSVLSFEHDAPEQLEELEADICAALKRAEGGGDE